MSRIETFRNSGGQFPAYAWPGGYPLYYLTADGGELCPACANGDNGSMASTTTDDPQWQLIDGDAHWEGPPLMCAHCYAEIPSAYGDPDAPEEAQP
jgi:hypothetical protein